MFSDLTVFIYKTLYSYECWGDSMKKEIFANKIEQFHMSMCKQNTTILDKMLKTNSQN